MKFIAISLILALLLAPAIMAAGLQITEIDVNVDYDDAYTYRVEDRDRIDSASVPVSNGTRIDVDVLPGSNVTFTLRIENTFQGENPDLRGVFATISIEDIDDGADLEEESIDFDLEPGNDNRVEIKFSIPLDVDAGTYNIVIEAEGEDRNETSYRTELTQKLEVKKQSHDIRITSVLLNPSSVDCDRKARLAAEITNAGSNPESQVALEFKSGNLGINSFDRDIFLESSDEASEDEKKHAKTLNIEIPQFFQAGTFPIFINLYWKNFVLFDQKTVDLVVRECQSSSKATAKEEPKESGKDTVTVIQPKEEAKNGEIVTTTESSALSSPVFAIILGAFLILILAGIAAFGYWKKSKIQ
ncbi:hypothetical protein HYX07_04270 [Candidatus Woesearchaeota archaeon]|nr:hypothetical protein [Candidatus Woesearchaeota archaeon]